jgi:tRNA G18 (ribose-2'-O)-methylase SpoU
VVRVNNLAAELKKWSRDEFKITSYAAVIDTDNLLTGLRRGGVPSSWCCVMGNEGSGISSAVADACTQRIRIDMVKGVDSLSVPIACGILLHGLKEREQETPSE